VRATTHWTPRRAAGLDDRIASPTRRELVKLGFDPLQAVDLFVHARTLS
jgi:hypothetical protein